MVYVTGVKIKVVCMFVRILDGAALIVPSNVWGCGGFCMVGYTDILIRIRFYFKCNCALL